MTTFPWVLYVVTAVLSMIWAASEVISSFEVTPIRALFTWGAWLLMLTNAFFACLALMAVLQIVPSAADNLLTAFAVGFGWQALVRSQINVFRPLPGEPGSQGLVVPVDQIYGRIQRFVRRSIDQSLARERTQLLTEALALDLGTLKDQVQLMSFGLSEMDPTEVQNWLHEMESREITDHERKMLLASKLIEVGGIKGLKQMIKTQAKAARQPAPPMVSAPATVASDGAGKEADTTEKPDEGEVEQPASN
jgi:hypothetical protein